MKATPCEMHAHEVHAHKVHAYELYVCKIHACEIHAYKVHDRERRAHKKYTYIRLSDRKVRTVGARK
jgi:hypothetical protein